MTKGGRSLAAGCFNRARTLVGFAVVSAVLAAILLVAFTITLTHKQLEASAWVAHTLEVMGAATTLEADLASASDAGRAFIIVASVNTRQRFDAQGLKVGEDVATLRALTADNPLQQAALDGIAPLVASRLAAMRAIMAQAAAGDMEGVREAARAGRGRVLMDRIQTANGALKAEERRLLASRNQTEQQAAQLLTAGVAACGILVAVSALLAASLLFGRRRERSHVAELQAANAGLEALNAIGTAFAVELNQKRLIQTLLDASMRLTTANYAVLFEYGAPERDGGLETWRLASLLGVSQDAFACFDLPSPDILFGRGFRTDGMVRSAASGADHTAIRTDHPALRSYLAVPVMSRTGEILGALWLGSQAPEKFGGREERLATGLAGQAAIALDNAQLFASVRRSRERFGAAVQAMQGVVWTNDALGRMAGEQPGWACLTGQSFAEYRDYGWAAAVHPDDAQPTVDAWNIAVAQRSTFHFEHRVRRHDGLWRMFAVCAVPALEPDGSVREWVGVHTDISDKRAAEATLARHRDELECLVAERTAELGASEARLRESETGFRLLAEHAHDMVVRIGPAGTRLYVSPASMRIVGWAPEDLIGKAPARIIHPPDLGALESFMAGLLGGTAETSTLTIRALHRERGVIWVEVSAQALRHPLTGAPDGYIAAIRDISERRAAEDALRTSEARYRLLADSTSDVITCLSLDFTRTYVSPACRQVFGYEPEEMLGGKPVATMHPDDHRQVYRAIQPLVAGTIEHADVTYRVQHKAGHWVWVEGKLDLARDPVTGAPASLVCTLRDISERHAQAEAVRTANAELERLARHLAKARDVAERASRAKSRFLAGMSHELRTPLNGILGYAHLLHLEGGLNPVQAARVQAMLGAGRHLLEMINGVLDLSEIEAERAELRTATIDLASVAKGCLDLVRPAAEAKALALALHMASDSPEQFATDPTRFRQVLLNLLGNAVKFTAAGGVELRLQRTPGGGKLRVEVADSGPGVPPTERHRLFQDFERLESSGSKTVEGAGLGLALSARIASVMGGRIGYEDNPAGGSVFWLELPLDDARHPPVADALLQPVGTPDGSPRVPTPTQPLRLRILVVDDLEMNREIAASFLRTAGHETVCVESGARAIEAAANASFDAILMDVRMPDMDGLEATRRIRASGGPGSHVPVVALTAQAFTQQIQECRAAGMDMHLAKPFAPEALLDAVRQAVVIGRERSGTPGEAVLPAACAPDPIAAPSPGMDGLVFDRRIFNQTASYLPQDVANSHMRDLAERGEALVRDLHEPPSPAQRSEIAEAAHALAGSAGMFGFTRLADIGRHFEHALMTGVPDVAALTKDFRTTIEHSLIEMHNQTMLAVTAD